MYRVICEALEASRAHLGRYRPRLRAQLHVYGESAAGAYLAAPVCRSGSSTQRLKTLVPRRPVTGKLLRVWLALYGRGAADRALEARCSPFPGWLCHQSNHAGLGHAGQGDFRARGRRCSTWNCGEPTLQARDPGSASGASRAHNPNELVMSRARRAIVGLRRAASVQAWQCPTAAMRRPARTRPPANSGGTVCLGPGARSSRSTS
jgi:hypothetical protein